MLGRLFEFIISRVLQREYPTVGIEPSELRRDSVPHSHFWPYTIHLGFSEFELSDFHLTYDNLPDAISSILEHEYLHIILDKIGERKAALALNEINRYSVKHTKMAWRITDEEERIVWETSDG